MVCRAPPWLRLLNCTNSALTRSADEPMSPVAVRFRSLVRTMAAGPADSIAPRLLVIVVVPMGLSIRPSSRMSEPVCVGSVFWITTFVAGSV